MTLDTFPLPRIIGVPVPLKLTQALAEYKGALPTGRGMGALLSLATFTSEGEASITLVADKESATDIIRFSLPDQANEVQNADGAETLDQSTPLGDVITGFVPAEATATNKLSSGTHITDVHGLSSGAVLKVQTSARPPAVMIAPEDATATNKLRSGEKVTDCQDSAGTETVVQVSPSVDVSTRFVPEDATATNRAPDHVKERHSLASTGEGRRDQDVPLSDADLIIIPLVNEIETSKFSSGAHARVLNCSVVTSTAPQVRPSMDVITRFVPEDATAINREPLHTTERHSLASAAVRAVQVRPSGDVITRFVPVYATETNRESFGDHTAEVHPPAIAVVVAQVPVDTGV